MLAGRDARPLARELVATTQQLGAASRGSPTRRARLRALGCDGAVVLRDVGTRDDVVRDLASGDTEPLVREHVAWALEWIAQHAGTARATRAPAAELV